MFVEIFSKNGDYLTFVSKYTRKYMSTVVERIKELCSQLNLSENKFAGEIGVNVQTLNNYTSGKRSVSYDVIDKTLAKFPSVSAEWLIRGMGQMFCGSDPFASPSPSVPVNGPTTDLQRTQSGGTSEDTLAMENAMLKKLLEEKDRTIEEKERTIQILLNKQ